MLSININERYSWEELFLDPLINNLIKDDLHELSPYCRKLKRLASITEVQKLDEDFVSKKFKLDAGEQITNFYFVQMQKGTICAFVARNMEIIQSSNSELLDRNLFYKTIYYLYFRSFMICNDFNIMFSNKTNQFGS